MIPVTKPFLPPKEEYIELLKGIWDRNWLTNDGPLVKQFEQALKSYLSVENFFFVANGTIALQLAIKAMNITGEVITTPFSYVATTTALLWENCQPVFVDIDASNFCIDASMIEAAITPATEAILATHVFGHPCDVVAIAKIANKYNLKVIYDGAHAFGTDIQGRSLLEFGDISICSFHATKLFHTVEGGCVVTSDIDLANEIQLKRQFGHIGDEHHTVGINGKNSEFHAAMGLCNLNYIDHVLEKRKQQWKLYEHGLESTAGIDTLKINSIDEYNFAYFPIVLETNEKLLYLIKVLEENGVYPRRYFYPSLTKLPYLNSTQSCPIAESIAHRIICLPLYHDLGEEEQLKIVETITNIVK